jgi:hypothetical protein
MRLVSRAHLWHKKIKGPSTFCDSPATPPAPPLGLAPLHASAASGSALPPPPPRLFEAALELTLQVARTPRPLQRDEGRVVALAGDRESVGDARPG